MPEPRNMSNWAEDSETTDSSSLPMPTEKMVGKDTKVITSYTLNDEGKKVKHVRTYKIERKLVSKAVAQRKALAKFGESVDDRPGPDPATTLVAEEISMQFVANKEESEKDGEDKSALDVLKEKSKGVVKCRICKEDHWTTNCPYKETLGPLRDSLAGKDVDKEDEVGGPGLTGGPGATASASNVTSGGKYIPPSRRGGEGGARDRIGESMPDRRKNEDTYAIRVSNVSANATEMDLQELFKPFGNIARIFLAKDRNTGECKGFAFINYYKKEDAAKAISTVNRLGYDSLILNVEWAKPSGS